VRGHLDTLRRGDARGIQPITPPTLDRRQEIDARLLAE